MIWAFSISVSFLLLAIAGLCIDNNRLVKVDELNKKGMAIMSDTIEVQKQTIENLKGATEKWKNTRVILENKYARAQSDAATLRLERKCFLNQVRHELEKLTGDSKKCAKAKAELLKGIIEKTTTV